MGVFPWKFWEIRNFFSLRTCRTPSGGGDLTRIIMGTIFHLHIHSIELHIDELRMILKTLIFPESKINKGIDAKTDISINGYQPPLNTETESTKGE